MSIRWAALWLMLAVTPACPGQQPTAAASSPATPVADRLQQAVTALGAAMGNLDPSVFHLQRGEADAIAASQASLTRNLAAAVPGLMAGFRAAPEDLGAAFRLYRDLEAVLAVAQRTADALPADRAEADPLRVSNGELQAGLSQLGDWIEARGSADYARARAAAVAPRPAAAPPPPKTLIINDANAPAQPKPRAPKR